MNEVSIIINGVRYDSVPEEDLCSCSGCEFDRIPGECILVNICKKMDLIFKKSTKSFKR
jgi:hypothetical protein